MTRWTAVLLATPLLTLLAPGAAAHPVDVVLFTPLYVVPTNPTCAPLASPCYMLPPVTVTGVLTNLVTVGVSGAGACNVLFEACFAWPTWNPLRQAPPTAWWCQVTSHSPNWPAGAAASITAHLLYDADGNDLLTGAPDLDFSTLAVGPIPVPATSPRAGQWTGSTFGGAPLPDGALMHVVVTAPGGLVPDPRPETVVTCWVF